MNNDMKCPFCQQEMIRTNGTHNKVGVWQCQNYNDPDNVCIASGYLFNDDVLNYITRTRKALQSIYDYTKIVSSELAKNHLGQFQKPISKIGDMAHIALKAEQKD